MDYKDYYKILGVAKNAGTDEIRAAYRRLARKYHPDVNPGNKEAEQRFKTINEAQEVLSDPEKRRKYDQLGSDWERVARDQEYARQYYGQARSSPQWEEIRFGDGGDFSDFFATFFGGDDILSSLGGFGGQRFSRAASPQAGADAEQSLPLTVEEVFRGGRKLLQLQTQEPCPTCGGRGMISRMSGGRRVARTACPDCRGAGASTQTKTLEVKIPPGVTEGSKIRLAGQAGRTGGDLYLTIKIQPHPVYTVEGYNLRMEIPLLDYEAILGTTITLRVLSGPVSLKIPPSTQSGAIFRLRGEGLSQAGGKARGDLLVKTRIIIPEKLTEAEKKLITELKSLRQQRGIDDNLKR